MSLLIDASPWIYRPSEQHRPEEHVRSKDQIPQLTQHAVSVICKLMNMTIIMFDVLAQPLEIYQRVVRPSAHTDVQAILILAK